MGRENTAAAGTDLIRFTGSTMDEIGRVRLIVEHGCQSCGGSSWGRGGVNNPTGLRTLAENTGPHVSRAQREAWDFISLTQIPESKSPFGNP